MPKFIFSTMTGGVEYAQYDMGNENSLPRRIASVEIAGGANVPSRQLVTPRGVMTKVSDEEYKILLDVPVFQTHVNGGYIIVEDAPHAVEEVVKDMKPKDGSAPKTPSDFEEGKEPTHAEIDPAAQQSVNASQTDAGEVDEVEDKKPARRAPKRPRK